MLPRRPSPSTVISDSYCDTIGAPIANRHQKLTMGLFDEQRDVQQQQDDRMKQSNKKQRYFQLRQLLPHSTYTNDEIHSRIELPPVLVAIIDTRSFQRLRHIKQLSTAEYAYMAANHTRFEHSLGVAHLAGVLCQNLADKQTDLHCTPKDVLAVQLAGLLHDIGHGMFSHTFEVFVKQYQVPMEHQETYAPYPRLPPNWSHELVSLQLIDAVLQELGLAMDYENLDAPLQQIGDGVDAQSMRVYTKTKTNDLFDAAHVLTTRDFVFIKECIWGKPLKQFKQYVGRPHLHQEWLYNIVSNSHSGLDVDKMDYFSRDQRRCLGSAGEIDNIFLDQAVVAWGACTKTKCPCYHRQQHRGQHLMICYPDKLIVPAIHLFQTRCRLHQTIYQHKTTVAVHLMIIDILTAADPYFLMNIENNGGNKKDYTALPLSRSMHDYSCWLRLKDCLIEQIANTTSPELAPARRLIDRLHRRQLYKCVGNINSNKSEADVTNELLAMKGIHNTNMTLERSDFVVTKCKIHWGGGPDNPVQKMRFLHKLDLEKDEIPEAKEFVEEQYLAYLPRSFQEVSLRCYARNPAKTELVRHVVAAYADAAATTAEPAEDPMPVLLSQDEEPSPQQPERLSLDGRFFISPQKLNSFDEGSPL